MLLIGLAEHLEILVIIHCKDLHPHLQMQCVLAVIDISQYVKTRVWIFLTKTICKFRVVIQYSACNLYLISKPALGMRRQMKELLWILLEPDLQHLCLQI